MVGVFKINGRDFSEHVHSEGISFSYSFRKGLPDKDTMDGIRHVDLGSSKRIVTIRLNPTEAAATQSILTEYRKGVAVLTVFDRAVGAAITFNAQPGMAISSPALARGPEIVYDQISPLTFEEL